MTNAIVISSELLSSNSISLATDSTVLLPCMLYKSDLVTNGLPAACMSFIQLVYLDTGYWDLSFPHWQRMSSIVLNGLRA